MSRSRAKKKQRQRSRAGAAAGGASAAPAVPRTERPPRDRRGAPQGGPTRLEVRDGVARPDAIWAPFPLTEIGMAGGIGIVGAGFVTGAGALLLVGVGVLVVVVAELCMREHFAGYRSHSLLLATLPLTAAHAALVIVVAPSWRGPLALAVDLALAGALAWWLQRRFGVAQRRARIGTA